MAGPVECYAGRISLCVKPLAEHRAPADGATADGTVTDSSTYNEKIGVITQADGTLIDAQTGGIIDPETGAIRSSVTGQFIGMNNRYIEVTYCGVTY